MKPIEAETCVEAWLEACAYLLKQPDWRAYTIVLEIADPLALPARDKAVHDLVDGFLRQKKTMPINTVVNTIFPAQLYARFGASGVYDHYPALHPQIQCHDDSRPWGTYAMRMIQRTDHNGQTISPLLDLVNKISREAKQNGGKRAVFELGTVDPFTDIPIYDPGHDRNLIMASPCLSHVSAALTSDHAVRLSGFYRSHFYITRALGNFLGLAHLQHFIAQQAGIEMGPLVVHSSMAQLDIAAKKWGNSDVRKLIEKCMEVRSDMAA